MRPMEVSGLLMIPLLIFGIFGNLHLIYATHKFKELQTRNGILIAIAALFDLVCFLVFATQVKLFKTFLIF
ncbi:unnamed protein product [Gongylonema pulchrum]|uniref:G_PROTEIN_RECEP_F1_2 domain-containing protein n=1 Tax=Gongylonema pulchrum TaxID=637853 RepID=A0A183CW61_9BILA|nr:unnamed protein product [Gongylonema pulchrum]